MSARGVNPASATAGARPNHSTSLRLYSSILNGMVVKPCLDFVHLRPGSFFWDAHSNLYREILLISGFLAGSAVGVHRLGFCEKIVR